MGDFPPLQGRPEAVTSGAGLFSFECLTPCLAFENSRRTGCRRPACRKIDPRDLVSLPTSPRRSISGLSVSFNPEPRGVIGPDDELVVSRVGRQTAPRQLSEIPSNRTSRARARRIPNLKLHLGIEPFSTFSRSGIGPTCNIRPLSPCSWSSPHGPLRETADSRPRLCGTGLRSARPLDPGRLVPPPCAVLRVERIIECSRHLRGGLADASARSSYAGSSSRSAAEELGGERFPARAFETPSTSLRRRAVTLGALLR